jgi:TolB protein
MSYSRTILLVLASLLLLTACALSAPTEAPSDPEGATAADTQESPTEAPASETPEPTATEELPPARIVFSSNEGQSDDQFNLFTIDPQSGEIVQLTDSFGFAGLPGWSPDRTLISFFSNDDGFRVYTIGADGQNLTQVTDFSSAEPNWFPNSQRLVFNSDHQTEPAGVSDLYAMNLDGSDLGQIIDSDSTNDYQGEVSPDGTKLLFHSDRTGNPEIFVANMDGSEETQLTDTPGGENSATWSPDGTLILYAAVLSGNTDLWVMNADGSNPEQLTHEPGVDGQGSWSPDGSQIVFVSDRGGSIDLWVMKADGSDPVQLTTGDGLELFPDW